jgi:hypothetical protein
MVNVPNVDYAPPPSSGGYTGWQTFANATMAFGITQQALASYYGVLSSRYEARSKALEMETEATLASTNARMAEQDAQLAMRAGADEMGRVGLQYRQLKGQERVRQAAGGVAVGVGSAAEVSASISFSKEADMINIDSNATRAAAAARTRSVDASNQARAAMVSAGNLRGSARSMSPALAGAGGFISGAGLVAGQWAAQSERSAYYRSRSEG